MQRLTRKERRKGLDDNDPRSSYAIFLEGNYVRIWESERIADNTVQYIMITVGIRLFL
jgi:hypothetical protein